MIDWKLVYYLSEWAIRLIMLVYVPQRRSPAAARTWLLLIFMLPWAGLVLYLLVGRPYLPRHRVELQERISGLIRTSGRQRLQAHIGHPELPPQFELAVTLARNLGDFSIMCGNQIELLPDYDESIGRLVADIAAARRHVHLLYYIFADDRAGLRVIEALSQAAARGIPCRVLYDSLGSKPWRRRLKSRLQAAGVEAVATLPFRWLRRNRSRLDLRNHRKIAVIDGRVAYVGSQNLVAADFKPGIVYKELVARVTGPAVLQLQAVLLTDLLLETESRLDDEEVFPEPERAGQSPAQALPSGPGFPHANNQRLIVALVHASRQRVVITTPYFVPDDALLQALQTAVLRGVEVHLVVSRKADQLLVGLGQRSYYEDLLESGVRIHEFQKGLLHAKHVSIDDEVVLIGSSNLDIRSFQLNSEISLLVYDAKVAAALREEQERNMAAAVLLTAEQWRKRPLHIRTAQNLARLMDSLL